MSVKELSALLFSKGFRMVGKSSWKMGKVEIILSKGFLYVLQRGETLGFPFRACDNFYITVFGEKLVICWNDMVYTHEI